MCTPLATCSLSYIFKVFLLLIQSIALHGTKKLNIGFSKIDIIRFGGEWGDEYATKLPQLALDSWENESKTKYKMSLGFTFQEMPYHQRSMNDLFISSTASSMNCMHKNNYINHESSLNI